MKTLKQHINERYDDNGEPPTKGGSKFADDILKAFPENPPKKKKKKVASKSFPID